MKQSDTTALGMFDNLEDKQIWHISAPSTVPISLIETLDVATSMKGAEILNHKGLSYELSRAPVEGATVLLPQGGKGEYASVGTRVTRAFRIQQYSKPMAIERSSANTEPFDDESIRRVNFFATQSGQRPPPRKQPQNLKARYVPYGVISEKRDGFTLQAVAVDEDATMLNADADPVAEPATAPTSTPKSSKKNKHKEADDIKVNETPSKQMRTSQASPLVDTPGILEGSARKKKKENSKKGVA